MKILLTGASGFVGRAMRQSLLAAGHDCIAVTRSVESLQDGSSTRAVGEISSQTDWRHLLANIDVVLHLAGRAHVLGEQAAKAQELFDAVNVEGTMNLARQAVSAGVKRFVYVSSIGVHGACTRDAPITEISPFLPYSPYTESKCRAELKLQALAGGSLMEWVIVRPPLVYAADAPGNFQQLLMLVNKGLPLPFGGVRKLRSMVALENLVDFLSHCCVHANAKNQDFVICDGYDVSIDVIVRSLATGMKKKARFFWLPNFFLKVGARLIGRQHTYTQLFESLQVDASKAAEYLEWKPVVSPSEALMRAGKIFSANATQLVK